MRPCRNRVPFPLIFSFAILILSSSLTNAQTNSATFVRTDTATQGNWHGAYGADGYSVADDSQNIPSYATFAVNNQQDYTWAATTADVRALQTSSGNTRIAAAWYNSASFGFDVNLTDGNTHQIALYVLDWDSEGRSETIQIVDASSQAVLDTQNASAFANGEYLVWNVSGHVLINVTQTGGANAAVSGIFFGGSSAVTSAANFVRSDNTTEGNWHGQYGADGYSIANDTQSIPAYASFLVQNQSSVTWASSTSDQRALQTGNGAGRIAATWYAASNFNFDLNVTDGNTHQFALYALDWDVLGRAETIQVLDAGTDAVLDTRSISNFGSGQYLVWNISGHVKITVISTSGNAVISGAFFGGSSTVTSSAAFLRNDATTEGNWHAAYGADGYSVANDSQSIPSYASFAVQNQSTVTWVASTGDPRAPQTGGGSNRIAAAWYSSTAFNFDVNITDGNSHQFALYALDWDSQGRSEAIQVLDAATEQVLDTRNISNFTNGVYLVWNISGHVHINVIVTSGPNAVVSAAFFGGSTSITSTAAFIASDATTEGNWQGVYGVDGYSIANAGQSIPAYASFAVQNASSWTWDPNPADPRALQTGTGSGRIAAAWYNSPEFNFDLNFTDGKTHEIALYAIDWEPLGRSEVIQVLDAATEAVLDSQTISGFSNGVYLAWNISGHVTINVIGTAGANAVVSGVFFSASTGGGGIPTLQSIAVTPANASVLVGSTQQFVATGTYSDGSTQNLTSSATWTSSSTAVAVVDSTGLGSALSAGQTSVQASVGSISGSTSLTVVPIGPPVLNLRTSPSPGEVDLSDPINLDWIVWGGDPQTQQGGVGVTRMSGGSLISDVTFVNSNNTSYDQYGLIRFDWNNGSPVSSATQSTPELNAGVGTVIQLTAPADVTVKTLKLYIGLWGPTKIDAAVSDGSAAPITTMVGNDVSEADELFSLDYRAASTGQTITVTITALQPDGFFDLYAAALAPHVPDVSITNPAPNQGGISGNVLTSVTAQQFDFDIADVQLLADNADLFDFTQPPYSSTWSNIPTGHHTLSATATDTNGLSGTSTPVEFDVIGAGGSLTATVQDPPASVDLTQEGTADWRAWLSDNVIDPANGNPVPVHKAGVVPQLSDATIIGNHLPYVDGSSNAISFIDGVPTPTGTNIPGEGIFNGETGTGLELTAPADGTPRTLRLYVGVGWGDAQLEAFLSDGSAPVLVDTSISSPTTEILKVYTINYQAASANQTLTVRFTLINSYLYGNVSFFAASLQGPVQSTGPTVTAVIPDIARVGDPVTIYGAGLGPQQGSNAALLNGAAMAVTSWSPYNVSATVPAGSCGGSLNLVVNGTQTNSATLTLINMPADGTSLSSGSTLQLQAATPCGVALTGGYWQISNGTGVAALSNPSPNNPNQSLDQNPTLTGIASGSVTLSYFAADGTQVSSQLLIVTPTIASISVSGNQVTILGSDFGNAQGSGYVVLNNLYGIVVSWSDTQIVTTMQPATLSGNLYIDQFGLQSNLVPFTSPFSSSAPAISSISPSSGIVGDLVSINGANFGFAQSGSTVLFSGASALVVSWTYNAIVVQVPSGATTGNIVVNVGGVNSNGFPFTITTPMITSLAPNTGQVGSTVTIGGANFGQFEGSSFVYFNGTTAPVVAWSDSSITVTVPSGATTGDVVVYRSDAPIYNPNELQTSNGVPFTVTANPVITSLSATSGLPGKTIIISGSNFGWDQTVATVTFNGIAATPKSWSPTSVSVAVPSGATSGNVVVTVNGVTSNGVNFVVPALTSITLTPATPVVAVGSNQRFTATGNYSDGSSQSLPTATWSSSSPSVATIDASGNATAASQGQTTIQAVAGTVVGSATLTVASTNGTFAVTGSLRNPRGGHTATLLNNGQVLIAGGEDGTGNALNSTELYNPATGTFATSGALNIARKGHTASLLNNGMVLIAGGQGPWSLPVASAELYNPSTGTFFITGNLSTPRQYATATVLTNGQVLIVGGQNSAGVLASAEIYDPPSGTFTPTGSLNTERVFHTGTLLDDGTVLITGGKSSTAAALGSAELYNPATGAFSVTPATLNDSRQSHVATLLNNGKVLITEGFDSASNVLGSAELYDPLAGTFSYTASPNTARNGSTNTALENGEVLLAGGYDSSLAGLLSAEAYDPVAVSFSTVGNVVVSRQFHTATLLGNGNVLLAGGLDSSFNALSSAELYQPATTSPASLVSISVNPSGVSIPLGTSQRLTATGTFSDGSVEMLQSVSWNSSNPLVATVTSDATNSGSAYAVAAGSATLNACEGSICGTATVTVPTSQLIGIAITPANAVIVIEASSAFYATGTYSDGSTEDLTAFVTWSSSAPSVANISAIGVATGSVTGSTSITATYGNASASANLSVAPPLASISVTPNNLTLAPGNTQQFAATARYTDGTTGDVTNTVQWSSQSPQVATISAGGSLTAVGLGNTIITATSGGITGSANFGVVSPIIAIASVSPSTGVAGTQVLISGSGFGNAQGSGKAWLGTVPAVIVSWSDTQIIATVAPGSGSGSAYVQENGAFSNSLPFTVSTPNISFLSPSSGLPGTQVYVLGSGFGTTQGTGQVWLGTAPAQVSSWSDTQIIATVDPSSTSGSAQVLQNGVLSNAVPFAVGGPIVSGITPSSGPVGTVVTIRGFGFGALQENGAVWIGGTPAIVLEWTDTLIAAAVGQNAVSGVAKVQQNGGWSNPVPFTVIGLHGGFGGPSMMLVPSAVSMVVGDTRSLQATDSTGQPVKGLAWVSSDPTVILLSTSDPPMLTALAPGTVTITAGGASADVSVYSGATFPLGTTIWSNPGDGSGVSSIMPAVPSDTGADVFAINNSGNIQAIRRDGSVSWTSNVPVNDFPIYKPDFQGGMVIFDENLQSIYKLDWMTGQPYPAYAATNHTPGVPAVHTDGTLFVADSDGTNAWVTGLDPSTGLSKFQVPIPLSSATLSVTGQVCESSYPNQGTGTGANEPTDPIIAGDGFAYVQYRVAHSQSQIQDAVQPYPLAAYSLFRSVSTDLFQQNTGALLNDVDALKQVLDAPPVNLQAPAGTFDDIVVDAYNGDYADAGDLLANLSQQFTPLCNENYSSTEELHILRVGSDGSSADTLVGQWQSNENLTYGRVPNSPQSYTKTQSGFQVPVFSYFITNADQGAMESWGLEQLAYCAQETELGCSSNVDYNREDHLTSVPGGDVVIPEIVLYQNYPIQPLLQLEDGTYIGIVWSGSSPIARFDYRNPLTTDGILFEGYPTMVKFDASGNVLGTAAGYIPLAATLDGGVAASLYSTAPGGATATPIFGPTADFDADLNITSGLGSIGTQSWTGLAYGPPAQVDQVALPLPAIDTSVLGAELAGNPSQNGTAVTECACVTQSDLSQAQPQASSTTSAARIQASSQAQGSPQVSGNCPICSLPQPEPPSCVTMSGSNLTYLILVGDAGVNNPITGVTHNVNNLFNLAAQQYANDLQAQGNKVIACRISSIQDFNQELTQNGFITGDVVYFGHSGRMGFATTAGGPLVGEASMIFIGQGSGADTNIDSQNVKQLCDPSQGCSIDKYLSKNTAIIINGCEAGKIIVDYLVQYRTAIAELIANQLKRGVYAYEVGMYFSQLDASHDTHTNGENLKHPPNSLPMYMVPEGVPGHKPLPIPFIAH